MKCCCIFLIFFPLVLFAQKSTVFHLDSLKWDRNVRTGCKWHAGDNPEWVKVGFDDSEWEDIDPNKQFPSIPQVQAAEIGWFRFHIDVDSTWINRPISTYFHTLGASEFYFNEQILFKVGVVSEDPAIEKTYHLSNGVALKMIFSKQIGNVIAVRYSFTHSNFYFPKFLFSKGAPIELAFEDGLSGKPTASMRILKGKLFFVAVLGLFFGLAFTHFSFYYFLRHQKANLLFGLAMFAHGIFFLSYYFLIDTNSVSFYTVLKIIGHLGLSVYSLLLILAIHSYLKQPLTKGFWFILSLLVGAFVFLFTDINPQLEISFQQYSLAIATLYYLIILRRSIKAGNKNGLIIYYAGILCLIGLSIAPIRDMGFLPISLDLSVFIRNIVLYLDWFSVTLGMSLTLARDFARTDGSLQAKSKEVQQLSNEKFRIAADMHDDIGSDLSALNLRAEMIRHKLKAGIQPLSEIDSFVDFTRDIAKKVREVIWTVNVRHDSLSSIISYFDTYADDFFEPTNIVIRTTLPPSIPLTDINGESRKVLLMCFKESLNNVLKHAKASHLTITFTIDNHALTISIQDNGIGFDPSVLMASTATHGDGLLNMPARMTSIGGHCRIQTSPQGTLVVFSLPI